MNYYYILFITIIFYYLNNAAAKNTPYKIKHIKRETGWSQVKVRENADLHLSLLSQGLYNSELANKYDTNFYYPESAGKDIDIVIIDTGFNFEHSEFSNKKERILKCAIRIVDGEYVKPPSESKCSTTNPILVRHNYYHGEYVSDAAAGLIHGVASKANVYGVAFNAVNYKNAMAGLKYVRDNLIRPHKTVLNLSFGNYYHIQEDVKVKMDIINEMKSVVTEIIEKGAIVVAAGGNEGINSYHEENNQQSLPCSVEGVICVGAIDTVGANKFMKWTVPEGDMVTKEMNTTNYRKVWWSNYGKVVDIYGPGYIHVEFKDKDDQDIDKVVYGTSFTAPVISGVIATIMSENPHIEFTSSTMWNHLKKISQKNVIKGIPDKDYPNFFINNGKHVVYSGDNIYHGCGIQAGNKGCGHDKCCSLDGKCTRDRTLCKTSHGCQSQGSLRGCEIVRSPVPEKCGYGYGSCPHGYCCSGDGRCGKSFEYCGTGCQPNYGPCH
ncbi:carbohydrate-binding module family 18 protein [Piromyces sp. E2]|nr:carbohydrate-binding module family 18 protein [Piromyces sp. E2]|eukprot:OUM60239.1 carbohydrate-binding module family 18 protein [Piromyces sp. E2]